MLLVSFLEISNGTFFEVRNSAEKWHLALVLPFSRAVPAHMPTLEESGLGTVEYESTLTRVSDLADPTPTKKRRQRGTYTHYKAKIARR